MLLKFVYIELLSGNNTKRACGCQLGLTAAWPLGGVPPGSPSERPPNRLAEGKIMTHGPALFVSKRMRSAGGRSDLVVGHEFQRLHHRGMVPAGTSVADAG